jgi:hypothetical protein
VPLLRLARHVLKLGKLVQGDARLQHRGERMQLTIGGRPRTPAGAGVAIPGVSEAREAGAAAVAVSGEHRAHAALPVRVRAHDDSVRLDAREHRLARFERKAVDGSAEVSGGAASHGLLHRIGK